MSVQASVPGSAAEGGDTKERLLDAAERPFEFCGVNFKTRPEAMVYRYLYGKIINSLAILLPNLRLDRKFPK